LFVSPYGEEREEDQWQLLGVVRQEADWRGVRRGTVQHEIFEGDRAAVFRDGDALALQVNCTSEIGGLDVEVRYALVVTLEVAPELAIPLYDEIRAKIRARVAVALQREG